MEYDRTMIDHILTDRERLSLAWAVYAQGGSQPPRGASDLSMVKNETERAVEKIIAARLADQHRQICTYWGIEEERGLPCTYTGVVYS